MKDSKGPGSKGQGKSGGGLIARVADWEALQNTDDVDRSTKRERVINGHFHKPGSQRKGRCG